MRYVRILALALAFAASAWALASSANAQSTTAGGLPGYEIIRLGRGHRNRLDFAATIDGVKGLMFVDTGAFTTVLNAGRYGFILKNGAKRPPNLPLTAKVNELSFPLGIGIDVHFGAVHLASLPFPLVPQRYLYDKVYGSEDDRQYDGVLGENILRHYNAVVDCARLALYLNTDPGRKLDLASALAQNGWTKIPMANAGNNFTVLCTLGAHPYRLLVDTGAPFTLFDQSILYKEDIKQKDLPLQGSVFGYNPKRLSMVQLDSLQIGSYVAMNVHPLGDQTVGRAMSLNKSQAGDAPFAGLLGGDILAANGAMIDIGNHNLFLKHTGH